MITDVFCKIIKGDLPAKTVYKDDDFMVIEDINPQAPIHLLIIPVQHFEGLSDFSNSQAELLGKALILADKIAKEKNLDKGYRLVLNEGEHGGKLVPHLHFHLLGGRDLGPKIVK